MLDTTKYCASLSVGGNLWHERVRSFAEGVDQLRKAHDAMGFDTVINADGDVVQQSTLDMYPVCDDCTNWMNFHDWPMARFVIGVRGGIVREHV